MNVCRTQWYRNGNRVYREGCGINTEEIENIKKINKIYTECVDIKNKGMHSLECAYCK